MLVCFQVEGCDSATLQAIAHLSAQQRSARAEKHVITQRAALLMQMEQAGTEKHTNNSKHAATAAVKPLSDVQGQFMAGYHMHRTVQLRVMITGHDHVS